jgi:hypothetical protein
VRLIERCINERGVVVFRPQKWPGDVCVFLSQIGRENDLAQGGSQAAILRRLAYRNARLQERKAG